MKFYQQNNFRPYHKIASELNISYQPYRYQSKNTGSKEIRQQSPSKREQVTTSEFQRSTFKHIKMENRVVQPIWEHLYHEGVKSQKELLQKHNNSKYKIDIQCTFQPLIKQSKRYGGPKNSTFLERINVWHENKLEKMVREKQEEVNKDLKECTFTPHLNQKSKRYKEDSSQSKNAPRFQKSQNTLKERNRTINPYYSPIKQKKKKSIAETSPIKKQSVELNFAKQMIRSQLKKIMF